MSHPNFLNWELREYLRQNAAHSTPLRAVLSNSEAAAAVRSFPKPAFKIRLSRRVVVLALVSALIYLAVPVADAGFRLIKLYGIAEATKADISSGNLRDLHSDATSAYYHLNRLAADTRYLSKLQFLPKVGDKIKAINYTANGSKMFAGVMLPVAEALSHTNGAIADITPEQRKEIINHLSAESKKLSLIEEVGVAAKI